jgi:hypothetical protein
MSQSVTFRTTLLDIDVIDAAMEIDFDESVFNGIMGKLKLLVLPVLWEYSHKKIGTARNFALTDRGLVAELTVRKECRDCGFSLTDLVENPCVLAFGGSPLEEDFHGIS